MQIFLVNEEQYQAILTLLGITFQNNDVYNISYMAYNYVIIFLVIFMIVSIIKIFKRIFRGL